MFSKLESKGDTIVEVLIAIAVISSVLGIAYSIMNKNIQIMQDNQERTTASKLAQTQIEKLRVNSDSLASAPSDFCFPPGDEVFTLTSPLGNDPSSGLPDDFAEKCISDDDIYYTSIEKNGKSYVVRVRWSSLTGQTSQVVMGYKLGL